MCSESSGLEVMKAAAEGAGRESVNKLANFFGAVAPFWGMRKKAADVYIKAIENGDYTPEEKYMLIAGAKKHCKELENQMAIAEIAQQVAADGTDFSMNSDVSDEFVSRIMDAGKHVSDEETRLLWGNVLAGEFESPGSTPWSVIRILSEMTRNYAQIFSNLCSLQIDILADSGRRIKVVDTQPFIDTHTSSSYLDDLGLRFSSLQELERLGLICMDSFSGYVNCFHKRNYPKIHLVSEKHVLTVTDYNNDEFPIGDVVLTEAGRCISHFVRRTHNQEHILAIKAYAEKRSVKFGDVPEIEIIGANGNKKIKRLPQK